ncbi:MAG: hypothetical protein EBT97_09595 [Actinobacteria bacterium]|jgi:hypothetical protein|nr:hypothetical protein [Actinomycetota bacterium]
MTLTNAYASMAALKAELNIGQADTSYDVKLETALNSASRQIDRHCGRRFWQDTAVVDRQYYADTPYLVHTDDISTLTGLVVKVDTGDDGTYATTLTINTQFIVLPTNAGDDGLPWYMIRLVDADTTTFPLWTSGRPSVQVTAKFGFATVPDDVNKACLIQATQLFKASDAVFGGLSFDAGILRVRETLNPMAAALVEYYVKPRVA